MSSPPGLKPLGPDGKPLQLQLPPQAVVVSPPTPITPVNAPPRTLSSFARRVVPSRTVQAVQEEEAAPMLPSGGTDSDDRSLAPLPPHAQPMRGSSTPIPRSEEVAREQSKERDDSVLLRSPPVFSPSHLPGGSPDLFTDKRTPSPSSADVRGTGKNRPYRRESSNHVVRETTLAQQTSTVDGERMVNQYKIGKRLGKGAYATVEMGIDVGTGEPYAVKEFSKARLQQQALMEMQARTMRERRNRQRPAMRGRPVSQSAPARPMSTADDETISDEMLRKDPLALIRREIAVMKKLDHPNLTKLFEAISVPNADGLFLVLEYLPGGVLMQVEAGRDEADATPPFTQDQTREYFRQICLGLEYLHANGVAHRDIKPDNILFTADRSMVKLADFGVSDMFEAQGDDRIKSAGGSPAFLSPESFTSAISEVHGKAVDVWALGVTLYCMLTGKLPFNVSNPIELFAMVRDKEPHIPEDWHRDLQALVKGMLNKDPEKRFTMNDIRENSWVHVWGSHPMMSVEDNLFYFGKTFEMPTMEEVRKAITSLRCVFTVVRAVHKMRNAVGSKRSLWTPSPMSAASGSMDSYTLPEAVTTPSELSEASPPASPQLLSTSPEAESTLERQRWALPQIYTKPPSTDVYAEPTMMESPTDASPAQVNSPLAESPVEANLVDSPVLASAPVAASPDLVASPSDSPVLSHSPVDEVVAPALELTLSPSAASPPGLPKTLSPIREQMPRSHGMAVDTPVSASPKRADVDIVDSPTSDSPVLSSSPTGL